MRRVLIVGTTGFLLFSVAFSLAPTIGAMIAARALQGAFGGVLIPLSFQLIATELPLSRRPPRPVARHRPRRFRILRRPDHSARHR